MKFIETKKILTMVHALLLNYYLPSEEVQKLIIGATRNSIYVARKAANAVSLYKQYFKYISGCPQNTNNKKPLNYFYFLVC